MTDVTQIKNAQFVLKWRTVFMLAVFVLLFLAVVVPNSLQMATMVAMAGTAMLALPLIKWTKKIGLLLMLYLISAIVTAFYTFVGVAKGAPLEAVLQVSVIYLISPLLWSITAFALFQVSAGRLLERVFVWYAVMAVASVGLFFFLFFNFGASSVSFFKENANLHYSDGYAGATMYVYGALIFITSGLYASPNMVRSNALRVLLLGGLALVAITSGRAALILSIPIGIVMGMCFQSRLVGSLDESRHKSFRSAMWVLVVVVAMAAVLILLPKYSDVDIALIFGGFWDELTSGGGNARSEQGRSLLRGVLDSYGLGAGHGVGVDYIRSDRFPWRYELVLVATIYRVGLVGALLYSLAFVMCFTAFIRLALQRELAELDLFFMAGFLSAMLASNTNPYIESFALQWMFVLPIVWFIVGPRRSIGFYDP